MRHLRHKISQCNLFRSFSDSELYSLLQELHYRIAQFSKGQTIAIEGAPCSHLGIVISGEVTLQKVYRSGKVLTMSRLSPGAIFGEVIIFSDEQQYPATVLASKDGTEIMFIARKEIVNLCYSRPRFLESFLGMLSGKVLTLNRRIKTLSYPTIRKKLASYILRRLDDQDSMTVCLPISRQELANELGVTRPSLSRELGQMKADQMIDFDRASIHVRDAKALRECLWE